MATWIWAIDANSGSAGWEKSKKAAYFSFFFNWTAEVMPVYIMANVTLNSTLCMIIKVIAAAGSDKISRMVLMGHGDSGVQAVGCGESVVVGGPTRDYFAVDPNTGLLFNGAETDLQQLAPYFDPSARLSLAGCWVAAPPGGSALLQRVSISLGNITVEGGKWVQDAALPGYFGPVIRCNGNTCSTIHGPMKEVR